MAELLFEVDLLETLLELDVLFFEPLELPDLVGINTLPSGRIQQFTMSSGSEAARSRELRGAEAECQKAVGKAPALPAKRLACRRFSGGPGTFATIPVAGDNTCETSYVLILFRKNK